MARTTAVRLTGEDLTPDDVWHVAVEDGAAELDDSAREKLAAAHAVVEDALRKDEPTYGVTTGFGRFVSTRIPTELAEELQLRLLRSHACGVGEPYPREIVRAAMVMRANTLAKGYSGTRVEVAELLLECLSRGVVPEVPSRGSVGASGDLAPLAHLALPLVGEGRARFDGELLEGGDALARAGLQPLRLEAKEGLSLVNGTQFMGAFAALGVVRARRLAKAADVACALSVDALQASRDSFLPRIHELRPLAGQAAAAANILALLDDSAIDEAHRWCDQVQDAYSLRCAAQVHGAARDLIEHVAHTASVELNAATDNPLVFPEDGVARSRTATSTASLSPSRSTFWRSRSASWRASRSGGPNGSSTPRCPMDCRVPAGGRRPQLRFHDPAVRRRFARQREQGAQPPGERGLDPDERRPGGHVSMGNAAGLKAWQVLANAERVVAIELLAGAQAVEFHAPLAPGVGPRAARELVRSVSPRLGDDRSLSDDIESVAARIRDGSAIAAVEAEAGELQ